MEDRLWKIVQSVAGALQVLSCNRVVVGKVFSGVDGEGGLIAADGLLKILPAVAGGEFPVGVAEVVLGGGYAFCQTIRRALTCSVVDHRITNMGGSRE